MTRSPARWGDGMLSIRSTPAVDEAGHPCGDRSRLATSGRTRATSRSPSGTDRHRRHERHRPARELTRQQIGSTADTRVSWVLEAEGTHRAAGELHRAHREGRWGDLANGSTTAARARGGCAGAPGEFATARGALGTTAARVSLASPFPIASTPSAPSPRACARARVEARSNLIELAADGLQPPDFPVTARVPDAASRPRGPGPRS